MAHALLSPSSAHRWLHCTAAPILEAQEPDSGSDFTREGSLAHAYAAKGLKHMLGLPVHEELAEIAELKDRYLTDEMPEHVEAYVCTVWGKYLEAYATDNTARLLVENRITFADYVPDSWGTADAIILASGTMDVVDFKYGKGVEVSAQDNAQMKLYALGAYLNFYLDYDIDRVRMTIVQPRLGNVSTSTMLTTELLAWARVILKPLAIEAASGQGKQAPGEWCRFCKVKARCRALADMAKVESGQHPDPRLLKPEELAALLPKADAIADWAGTLRDYALQLALEGKEVPGYKAVAGRSVRRITDADRARQLLSAAGLRAEQYDKPAELRGIGELERLLGKKHFAEVLGECIGKSVGKPALVPQSDKRPALTAAAADFAGIDVNEI